MEWWAGIVKWSDGMNGITSVLAGMLYFCIGSLYIVT